MLINLCSEKNLTIKQWDDICFQMGNKHQKRQYMGRWATLKSQATRRNRYFSDAEDAIIRDMVTMEQNDPCTRFNVDDMQFWGKVAERLPGRLKTTVRARYVTALDPCLDRSPLTQEESAIIRNFYLVMGNKWKQLSY